MQFHLMYTNVPPNGQPAIFANERLTLRLILIFFSFLRSILAEKGEKRPTGIEIAYPPADC